MESGCLEWCRVMDCCELGSEPSARSEEFLKHERAFSGRTRHAFCF